MRETNAQAPCPRPNARTSGTRQVTTGKDTEGAQRGPAFNGRNQRAETLPSQAHDQAKDLLLRRVQVASPTRRRTVPLAPPS